MTIRPARILVVDDEPQISRVMRVSFGAEGFDVRTAADGEAAMDLVRDWRPDLLVTDLAMPHVNGIELCRRVRKLTPIPIIVLSVKGDERTKIEALDAGADDYVTKPFNMNELLARVRAALRRTAPQEDRPRRIDAGHFAIDLEARRVLVDGREVHLTPKEFELLVHFAKHPGKVLTHRALLAAVWGAEHTEQTEYLRVFVGQLRKKIEPDAAEPKFLRTEPWVGYRFEP
jgi:two-component system, OmpR family, KDP operon response regulator KdpE